MLYSLQIRVFVGFAWVTVSMRLRMKCEQVNKSFQFLSDIDKWNFISQTDKQLICHNAKHVQVAFEKRRAHL